MTVAGVDTIVMHATRYEFRQAACWVGAARDSAHLEYDPHAITVEWRGGDTWAITPGPGWSPGRVWCEATQEWEWEPSPSNREDDFIARTRYTEKTALAIASRIVEAGGYRAKFERIK